MNKKPTIKLTTKSVNSKTFVKNIDAVLQALMKDTVSSWSHEYSREMFTSVVDQLLMEVAGSGHITQWDVICDSRNNTFADMDQGKFNFWVKFKQNNCFNVTQMLYEINIKP